MTNTQDYSASITWTSDWTAHLAANGNAFTISTATATVPVQPTGGTVTVANCTVTGAGKSVTFRVSQTGLTTPPASPVNVVVAVTLSNGDTDQRNFPILFTDT